MGGSRFTANDLCHCPGGVIPDPLKIMDYFPVPKCLQQFPGIEKKIWITRFTKFGLVNSEGLIYQQATIFQSFFYAPQQRAMQIAKDQDCSIGVSRQRVWSIYFQVHLPDHHPGSMCFG